MKGIRFPGSWAVLAIIAAWTAMAMIVFVFSDDAGGYGPGAADASTGLLAGRPTHPSIWHDERTFFDAVRAGEALPVPDKPIAGAIVPHHWVGGHLIAAVFSSLSVGSSPDTVVLVGPNHNNAGSARALTSDRAWSTPFGPLEPDEERIRSLVEAGLIEVGSDVLTAEHSIAGIVPAIKYYLPEARVVPIVLRGDFNPMEACALVEALSAQWGPGTVLVASVDFSHGLVQAEAERHDAVTLAALRASDADTLFTFDNAYLDSPASIAVLMETMAGIGAGEFVLLENTNSGVLANDQFVPTTSYIAGYYPQPGPGGVEGDAGGR